MIVVVGASFAVMFHSARARAVRRIAADCVSAVIGRVIARKFCIIAVNFCVFLTLPQLLPVCGTSQ